MRRPLLSIVGVLNVIYGIGALDDANILANDQRFVLTDLNTLGWVLILLGLFQFAGGVSLMAGYIVHGILVYGGDEQAPA